MVCDLKKRKKSVKVGMRFNIVVGKFELLGLFKFYYVVYNLIFA